MPLKFFLFKFLFHFLIYFLLFFHLLHVFFESLLATFIFVLFAQYLLLLQPLDQLQVTIVAQIRLNALLNRVKLSLVSIILSSSVQVRFE